MPEEIDLGDNETSDEKYVVFKVQDWEEFRLKLVEQLPIPSDPTGHPYWGLMLKAVPDAVVIRRQEMFAAPALHMYACGIQLTCKIASDITDPKVAALLKIADYFHKQAVLSEDEAYKLPD